MVTFAHRLYSAILVSFKKACIASIQEQEICRHRGITWPRGDTKFLFEC